MPATPLSPNNIGDNRYLAGTNNETGITATPGGAQVGAYPLTAQISRIDTVATAGDSVALPEIQQWANGDARPGAVGQLVFVRNSTVNAVQVFGTSTDTINGVASGTGISLPAGKSLIAWAESLALPSHVGSWAALISA
jgi:hypothetical protein